MDPSSNVDIRSVFDFSDGAQKLGAGHFRTKGSRKFMPYCYSLLSQQEGELIWTVRRGGMVLRNVIQFSSCLPIFMLSYMATYDFMIVCKVHHLRLLILEQT
eukprot:Em0013g535a